MSFMRLVITIIVLLLITSLSNLQAKDYFFDYQRVIETGADAELTLDFISGDLTITSSDDNRIIINAVKRVHAVSTEEAQLVADHIEIKVKHDKNRVEVAANYLRMRNRGQSFWSKILGTGGEDSFGEIDWNIQVPVECRVSITNTNGKVIISNIIGDVEIENSASDIDLSGITGNIGIRSSAADIELSSIEGSVNIENSAGKTNGELLFGPVSVRQAHGSIDLKFVEGDIKVKSSTAGISIRQDQGALDLTTSTGNVDIQTNLDSSRDYFVRTESGSITLTIPETSSGNLRIESQTGDIQTDIPIAIRSMSHKQVEGVFGFGGVKISLTSISGNVTVAQF